MIFDADIVLKAIRNNPKILFEICRLPELNTRQLFPMEFDVFINLEREAHAKFQFRADSRRSRYYRHLSPLQRRLMRLEADYKLNRPALAGMALFGEIARVVNGLTDSTFTARLVKDELEIATEILKELEYHEFVHGKLGELFKQIA